MPIFFVVTGIAQLFWVIPLIRGWGNLWYILGSVVTVALIVSWVSTNAPLPVKGVVVPYDVMSITIETSGSYHSGCQVNNCWRNTEQKKG
jgi:ABC-type transport system involved in cytochrome c biogenesis permease subunit